MSKVIAVIPARASSKSIENKPLIPLLNKPLLAYSIEAALHSGVIDEVYVSSGDPAILSIAQAYGARVIERARSLALDDVPIDAVVTDALLKTELETKDVIVLLQPSSPLRTAQHIREALSEFRDFPGCHCLMGVYEISNTYLKAYIGGGEFLRPVGGEHTSYARRHDLPSLYMPNKAIYIFTVGEFLREEKIPGSHIIPYLMSDQDSLDIETRDDVAIAEKTLQERLTARLK